MKRVARTCGIGSPRKWWFARNVFNKQKLSITKTEYLKGSLILDGHELVYKNEGTEDETSTKFVNWGYRNKGKYQITKKLDDKKESKFILNKDLVQTTQDIWEGVTEDVNGKKMHTSIWFRDDHSFTITYENPEEVITEIAGCISTEDIFDELWF